MSDQQVTKSDGMTPGAVLADARVSLGLTQREIADVLNLTVTVLDALERGDNRSLPSIVFIRGYVRAYAKLLELDPEPLVAALSEGESRTRDGGRVVTARRPAGHALAVGQILNSLTQVHWIVIGVVVVTFLVGLGSYLLSDDPAQEQATAPDLAVQSNPPQQSPSARPDYRSPVTATVQNRPVEPVVSEPMAVVVAAESVDPLVEVDVDAAAVNIDNRQRLTPTGDDDLRVEFSEDCWLEIKSAEGEVLFADLGRAGQTLMFVGLAPYTMVLGYAPGVILEFNSEVVALAPHTRNNIASLVLGQ